MSPPIALHDARPSSPQDSGNAPQVSSFHHLELYVSNAKILEAYLCSHLGFRPFAYRGLETGTRHLATHVISNGTIRMALTSPLRAPTSLSYTHSERQRSPFSYPEDVLPAKEKISAEEEDIRRITAHLIKHGDAVHDIAFNVDNCRALFDRAVENGAVPVSAPKTVKDSKGSVTTATIRTYGDTVHTLIEATGAYGLGGSEFMPGYKLVDEDVASRWETIELEALDHCVGNMDWDGMDEACDFYQKTLSFHRFWSIDDKTLATEFSSLSSTVMAAPNNIVKLPINEPAIGKRKSQIEEYVEYNAGPGVQHLALRTQDIIKTVTEMKRCGVEFIKVPVEYYDVLRQRLKSEGCEGMVIENWEDLMKLGILVDFDRGGYLLQLFTKPLMDRPTVFIEIIQRKNFEGFGAGNFKSLFQAIEREQEKRGNL